jgi:hypothetical protein
MENEDIARWRSTDRLWSVSEHPGRRRVFAMRRTLVRPLSAPDRRASRAGQDKS